MSKSLQPHGVQHARLPCLSLSPRVWSDSCPLSWWCYPIISAAPFSFCLQSFPASGYFPMSRLFGSGGQTIRASASASIHPIFRADSFRIDWFDLLAAQGTLKSLFQHHSSKASILWCSAFFMVQLSHPYVTTGKTIALTRRAFVSKVMSLLLNMLSRSPGFVYLSKNQLWAPLFFIILFFISISSIVVLIFYFLSF